MSAPMYWRKFTRDGSRDVDTQADAAFLEANFTDYFGRRLQEGDYGSHRSYDALMLTFTVADGSFIPAGQKPPSWFNPHIRVVTLVCQGGKSFFNSSPAEWTLCIVGSSSLYSEDRNESFLQVVSWNGSEFKFYQNDIVNGAGSESFWNYFGKSMDAFGESEYLGPFNGHVNGACIMKELRRPWPHWYTLSNSFQSCFSPDNVATLEKAPYTTIPGLGLLSGVNPNPAELESAVSSGVANWTYSRFQNDFMNTTQRPFKPLKNPTNISRWTAHMFLTTTINIGATTKAPESKGYHLPYSHFYDNELHQKFHLIPDFTLPWRSLGGDKRDRPDRKDIGYKIALAGEGPSPFNFLQSSFEDAQGVVKIQNIIKDNSDYSQPRYVGLFTQHTFYTIMMLDFWNPVYSWKRGILMRYVPQTATFNDGRYDLDAKFVANVKKSPHASEPGSPEYEFLQLLNKTLPDFQQMIRDYLAAVVNRIKTDLVPALKDYLSLAESRRRIYRPLPLDECGYSLPYATEIPFIPGENLLEMTLKGTIQVMDQRGQAFLNAWTVTLAEPDPHVIPPPAVGGPGDEPEGPALPIYVLPRPGRLEIPCRSLTGSTGLASASCPASRRSRRAGGGCPFGNQNMA
ncbi:uncharacterized protein C8A04DRAFT_39390 [Dichotomopilus funicola]|uniref:Uncharacterized protein n=1 Tax=Dichotomopilus funicola TaxID=1934379 RepID=A0AAN6V038_9PEZI|nr:hypothetical protein C8A04DRAFT_39390 [Dichotomopilus funicola]